MKLISAEWNETQQSKEVNGRQKKKNENEIRLANVADSGVDILRRCEDKKKNGNKNEISP